MHLNSTTSGMRSLQTKHPMLLMCPCTIHKIFFIQWVKVATQQMLSTNHGSFGTGPVIVSLAKFKTYAPDWTG